MKISTLTRDAGKALPARKKTISLPDDIREIGEGRARDLDRSFSNYLVRLIREDVARGQQEGAAS